MNEKHFIKSAILFCVSSLLFSCSSTETLTTFHTDQAPAVNGQLAGWPTGEAAIHQSETFDYYAMRDSDYLYIYVDFLNPFYNEAVNSSGFILYLSKNEKNKKRRGLGFPSGTFNLLRENPATFKEMTTDNKWFQKPQNQETLEELRKNNFNQILIVERYEDSNNPQYGFVTKSQLEAQGVELEVSTDRRYYGLEYKIPLNQSAPFELEPDETYWIGFAIEPPEFRYPEPQTDMTRSNRYGNRGYGNRRPQRRGNQNLMIRRQMGQTEDWFKIRID
ncbi:MAG: hypothetical protein WD035_03745 [Balneolaceae bacterium]